MKDFELIYLSIPCDIWSLCDLNLKQAIIGRVAAKKVQEIEAENGNRVTIFSSLSNIYPVVKFGKIDISSSYYKVNSEVMIKDSSRVIVVCIDGWTSSLRVSEDIDFANENNIDVEYYYPSNSEQMWP